MEEEILHPFQWVIKPFFLWNSNLVLHLIFIETWERKRGHIEPLLLWGKKNTWKKVGLYLSQLSCWTSIPLLGAMVVYVENRSPFPCQVLNTFAYLFHQLPSTNQNSQFISVFTLIISLKCWPSVFYFQCTRIGVISIWSLNGETC